MGNLSKEFRLLINGTLTPGASTMEVINPATGKAFTVSPRASIAQAEEAIAAAKGAFPAWSALSYAERKVYLDKFADKIESMRDEFVRTLTLEQGKPLEESRTEIDGSIATLRYGAAQELGTEMIRENDHERIEKQFYAQGVVAAITPWNFPVILLMFKLAPALVTGNTVIAKPAPTTPLTTLLLGEAAEGILPDGVFQTLVDQNDIGPLLTSHPDIAHVSFTGSTPTGKKVLHSTVDTFKRFTLELGGNDAGIILDDADIDLLGPKIFWSAFYNAAQICFATKRLYVPTRLMDKVCAMLVRMCDSQKLGDGMIEGTTMGPIQNKTQYDKVIGYLEDAKANGRILCGGYALPGDGYFIAPTIVRDIPDSARVVREEQFGPVLPVLAYDDLEDVIARANDSEFGLGASVWTSDPKRGIEVSSRLQTGTCWVNQHLVFPSDVSFGGAKQSGLGRQNGRAGMEDFSQIRIVNASLL